MALDLADIDNTVDLWCLDDFRADMPPVYGREAVAQRLIRKITTRPGVLPFDDWDDQCIDVRDYLLSSALPSDIQRDVTRIILQDEQVGQSSRAQASLEDNGETLRLDFLIFDSEGPWTFALTITQAATSLRELNTDG